MSVNLWWFMFAIMEFRNSENCNNIETRQMQRKCYFAIVSVHLDYSKFWFCDWLLSYLVFIFLISLIFLLFHCAFIVQSVYSNLVPNISACCYTCYTLQDQPNPREEQMDTSHSESNAAQPAQHNESVGLGFLKFWKLKF